jgi:hypothetical protein
MLRTNLPPEPGADTATIGEDQTLTGIAGFVMGNDIDVEGDPLSFVGPATYTPPPNFNGVIDAPYTISDGRTTAQGVIHVTVTPGDNDPPIAEDDLVGIGVNHTVTIDVIANDHDPDLDDTISLMGCPTAPVGTATCVDGKIEYTASGTIGDVTFDYTIADAVGLMDTGTVVVHVTAQDPDAGVPDAGPDDGGLADGGTADAGTDDGGSPDAGVPDTGDDDGGGGGDGGCCSGSPAPGASTLALTLLVLAGMRRRRA